MIEGWIDPSSHWKATGDVQGGAMTSATIIDNNGIERDRGVSFSSEADFRSWVSQRTN